MATSETIEAPAAGEVSFSRTTPAWAAFLSAFAVAEWLAVAFSLGWYYTFTYYGRAGWPMPLIEPCAALILYYFSVINAVTEVQAVHWMLVFPMAAALWVLALVWTARRMGERTQPYAEVFARFAVASLPLALPGPWMAWIAGQQDGAFAWDRMVDVALRRGNVSPWPWLSPMYFVLGLASLALQLYFYRTCFPMPVRRAWRHYPLSAVVLVLVASVAGGLLSYPLRVQFE